MYELTLLLRETRYHMNNLECLLRNYADGVCVCVFENCLVSLATVCFVQMHISAALITY